MLEYRKACFTQGARNNFARVPNGRMLDIRLLKPLGTKTNIMNGKMERQLDTLLLER